MIIAIALLLAVFILGLSVLSGVSVANSGVNTRIRYRQAYYYARSTLRLLHDNLVNGELGDYVLDLERERLESLRENQVNESVSLHLPLSFSSEPPEGLHYVDGEVVLSYDVVLQRVSPILCNLSLDSVQLAFRTEYRGNVYCAIAVYSYDGYAEKISDEWIWTGDWQLRSIV